MLFSYSCAILCNYQNAFIHISKLKIINCVIKEYEFERGLLRLIGQSRLPHNSIMKLTQYPTTDNQLHSSTLYILQQDTKCSGS